MADWGSMIDKQLRDLLGEGGHGDLPGAGKPLQWDDDANTPEHLRMAHKILRENDLAPAWIMEGRELDDHLKKLRTNIGRAVQAYRGALGDAERNPDATKAILMRKSAEQTLAQVRKVFAEAAERYNRAVLSYNLKLPAGIPHRTFFDAGRELDKLLGLSKP